MSTRARKISTTDPKKAAVKRGASKRSKAVAAGVAPSSGLSEAVSRGQMDELFKQLQSSEERFRALARASSDVVYSMSADWKEMRHLVGRDFIADTLKPSQTWLQKYIPRNDQKQVMVAIRKAIRTKSIFELEHRVRRVDGSFGWTFSRAVPILDSKGRIQEWLGMASDVTARREAEEALRQSEQRLRAFLENSAVIGWLKDEDGRFVFLSENFQRRLGVRLADWLGKTDFEVWPREIAEGFRRNDLAVLKSRKPIEVIEPSRDADGNVTWWLSHKFHFCDSAGRQYVGGLGVDITARKQAEEELAHKQAQFQAILDNSPALISIKDLEGNVVLANRGFDVLDAPPLHELVGRNVFDLFPKDIARQLWSNDLAALKADGPLQSEETVKHKDGQSHTYLTVKFPLHAADRKPYGVCAISTDITTRSRIEAALSESEERFRLFMDNSPSIAWIKDEDGKYVYLNQKFAERFGARLELWRGKTDREFWPAEIAEKFRENDLAVLAANRPVEMVEEAENPDGSRSFWLSTKFPFTDAVGHRYIGGIALDITERQRLESEVLRIAEVEQARIGYDLHDGVGQTLTGVASLVDVLEMETDGEARVAAQRVRELVRQAIQEVRQLSHGLSPLAVRHRGLIGSLRLLADTVRQSHRAECVIELDGTVRAGGPENETQLFRIAQEAVSNALRHGRARRISITLSHAGGGHCQLVVADNGCGMKPGAADKAEGIGLRVMAYRAEQINGTLDIGRRPGGGVRITCRFPCKQATRKRRAKRPKA
ncbi:MAG: PAS domain-containing protein [Prosthecobacter sp.]